MRIARKAIGCLLACCILWASPGGAARADANDLAAECSARLKAAPAESIGVKGVDGWLFGRAELKHLAVNGQFWGDKAAAVSASEKKEMADPLPAIVRFHEDLKKLGIHLIVVPVPPKAVVYADKISGKITREQAGQRLDKWNQEFLALLSAKGVEVLDLTNQFLSSRGKDTFPLYCRQDTHWSGRACERAAAALAKKIKGESWYAAAPKQSFDMDVENATIEGDLWLDQRNAALPKETLALRLVGHKKGAALARTLEPVQSDENSPVLLMGDSHTLIFHAGGDMLASQAGLSDQLSLDLGFPVDLLGVRGSGSTTVRISLFRKAKQQPDYLKKKKVVVWVFSARDFTEASGGWRIVPIK